MGCLSNDILTFLTNRTPEIQFWNDKHEEEESRHNCQHLEHAALRYFSSTYLTVVVRIWEGYDNSPPFFAAYTMVKGSLNSGKIS